MSSPLTARARDGAPTARRLAYEIGLDDDRRSVLLDLGDRAAPLQPDTLPGYAAAFAPDGSEIAYLLPGGSAVVLRSTAGWSGARRSRRPASWPWDWSTPSDRGPPVLVAAADPASQTAELYDLETGTPRPMPGGGRLTGFPLRAEGGRLVFAYAESGVTVRAADGTTVIHRGASPAVSADGGSLAFLGRQGGDWTIMHARVGAEPTVLARSARPMAAPAISPDGSLVVYQSMPREDWELYAVGTDGGEPRRLTHEIQHDIFPQFVSQGRVLAVMGEGRHRRSYLYDVGPARAPGCSTTTRSGPSRRSTSGWCAPTGTP